MLPAPNLESSRARSALLACGVLTVVAAAIAMLWHSWAKWPDPLIDFGRELYVPWMLSEGSLLYRDIHYFNGPLSPHLNELWFRIFGVGLSTLTWVNLVLIAALVPLIYRTLRHASSQLAALAACLTFVVLFAFSQYVGVGNYNYVSPYSHEASHGMLLSWVVLAAVLTHLRAPRRRWLIVAGLAAGLVFLTKVEFFLAVASASVTGVGLWLWSAKPPRREALSSLGAFCAAVLTPPALAFALLSLGLPWSEAGMATLGSWWHLADSQLSALSFYRQGMGMDAPLLHLQRMLAVSAIFAAPLLVAAVLARRTRDPSRQLPLAILSFVTIIALATLFWRELPWFELGRPLPLCMITAGVAMTLATLRGRQHEHKSALVLIVFALTLSVKMILNTRLYHYGFVLAMPSMLLLVVALLDWIPAAIKRSGGQRHVFGAAALAALIALISWHAAHSARVYKDKTVPVAEGADAFLSDSRGEALQLAADWILENTSKSDTLAVLPEGVMLNYLSRRKSSVPIVNLMPAELLMFGEEQMLIELQEAPPSYIALIHKDTSEYGFRFFGQDYGQSIARWLEQKYKPVVQIGAAPLKDHQFGIVISRREPEGR